MREFAEGFSEPALHIFRGIYFLSVFLEVEGASALDFSSFLAPGSFEPESPLEEEEEEAAGAFLG